MIAKHAAMLAMLALAGASSPTTAPSASPTPAPRASAPGASVPGASVRGASAPARAASPSGSRHGSYAERYGMIEQHNIFLRDRTAPHSASGRTSESLASPTTRPAVRPPEQSLVLTGVAEEGEGVRAYVEDLETGAVMRVAVGDALARGRVVGIEIDAIIYELNGQPVRVELGSDLTGHPSIMLGSLDDLPTTAPATGPTATPPPGVAGLNPKDPNLSTEQKMKLRRKQGK
jgi:hypothetical protein